MLPRRYLIATLFMAAMLMLLAVVQAQRPAKDGGAQIEASSTALALDSFELLADLRLEEGWSPRFQGARDPDQEEPWPFSGGFGLPWEPPTPYLGDQGLALNGPRGRSEVALWRGLEWRHYRFDAPLTSARLEPGRASRLLVTLQRGPDRFETQLLEIPEGRVLWATESGPWSRFSWDGKAVLIGLKAPVPDGAWLLSTLPLEAFSGKPSLAAWDEAGLPAAPRGWPLKPEQLWDDGQDLPGHRLLVPWSTGTRMWFPRQDRLWIAGPKHWTLWAFEEGLWKRLGAGPERVEVQPPLWAGKIPEQEEGLRERSPLERLAWSSVAEGMPAWPDLDPAWSWVDENGAVTAWDLRWGAAVKGLPLERQRASLVRVHRAEWLSAMKLRASVKGWLPEGPEVALRELQEAAWVWVGPRVLLVRLQPSLRGRTLRSLSRYR